MEMSNSGEPARMLTLDQVAGALGVTVPTARKLVREGHILGFQIGGRSLWRVEPAELAAYIDREKAKAAARRGQ